MTTHYSSDPATQLQANGFAFVAGADFKTALPLPALSDLASFATSWNDLGVDTYMADGGRYRRRRFDVYAVSANFIQRKPPQPHYQSRDYNAVNGGIERWFKPFAENIATHPLLLGILHHCYQFFDCLTPAAARPSAWHVECHQFRIEARGDQAGLPTPEGLHRDGVDWVLVILLARENVAEGVTTIYDANRQPLGRFTLAEVLDAAYVDDSRVYHGVTAVRPIDLKKPAFRDVLVVTFRRS
jgi:hypothetical protein